MQPVEVGGIVEAELGDVEQEQRDLGEVEAAGAGDAVEAGAQVERRILGAEEQAGAGVGDGEAAKRLGAGGDGEGELGGDPVLNALGGPPSRPTEVLVNSLGGSDPEPIGISDEDFGRSKQPSDRKCALKCPKQAVGPGSGSGSDPPR